MYPTRKLFKHSVSMFKARPWRAFLAMLLTISIFAQDGGGQGDQMGDLSLGDLFNIKLKTGSFLELDLNSSPVSMTIIDKNKIERSGARTMSDLLEIYVPSFQYMYNRWNGEIWAMRGITADFNNKILYLVNGMKMNLQARNGAFTEVNLGLLGDIERVEVLEGPAGMVYGSGAIAGIINVVTKAAGEKSSGDVAISGNDHSWSIEGNANAVISEDANISMSGGYRYDEGLGAGKTRLYGYQDWPENALQSDWGPSKGSHGKTPGNIRVGLGFEWKTLSFYARATRQQHSTAEMFGRFPWDNHQRNYVVDSTIAIVLDTTTNEWTTTIDGTSLLLSASDSLLALAEAKAAGVAHNEKYFGDVEIDGTTYKYSEFMDDPDQFMNQYKQANQTRRFITDNVAAELKLEQPVGENSVTVKLGMYANQCKSLFENNGFNEEIPAWQAGHTSPDYTWTSFGERRYSGQAMFHLKQVTNLQSVFGLEYRLDDIGDDFQGGNHQFGSESKHVVTPIVYHNFALFTENHYQFNDVISALAGIRFDKHTRTDGVVSPKIAAIASPNEDHFFKLFWQMSSNNGSAYAYEFNENHYNFAGEVGETQLSNGKTYVDNPTATIVVVPTKEELNGLNPEKSMSVELITNHKFLDKKLLVSPSVSFNSMKDNYTWNSGVQRNMNMGDYSALVANLSLEFNNDIVNVGLYNTLQKPVNTDQDQISIQKTPTLVQINTAEEIANDLDTAKDWYKLDPNTTVEDEYKLLKEAVTYDGENFLNVASYTTKFYLNVKPIDWFSFNTNARIFWGLPGRKDVNKKVFNAATSPDLQAAEANANYLDTDWNNGILNSTMIKLNAALHFYLPQDFKVSFFGTNLLGQVDNNNSVRWQQMVKNQLQRKVYTMDTPSWELRIQKSF